MSNITRPNFNLERLGLSLGSMRTLEYALRYRGIKPEDHVAIAAQCRSVAEILRRQEPIPGLWKRDIDILTNYAVQLEQSK